MDELDSDFPDLDTLLDQAEQEIESSSNQNQKRTPIDSDNDNSFDPLGDIGNLSSGGDIQEQQTTNCELLELFFGQSTSISNKTADDVVDDVCVTPPEERHDEDTGSRNPDSASRGLVLCSEERIPSGEDDHSSLEDGPQDFEHSEAEINQNEISLITNQNLSSNFSYLPQNDFTTNSLVEDPLVEAPIIYAISQSSAGNNVDFNQPEVSEEEFEQYMSEMENEIAINEVPDRRNVDEDSNMVRVGDFEPNLEAPSLNSSYIDDSPVTNFSQPPAPPYSDVPKRYESAETGEKYDGRQSSDATSFVENEGEFGSTDAVENESGKESSPANSARVSKERTLRPLVEYFGGSSPQGSLSSEDLNVHNLVPEFFGHEHSINELGSVEPRWVEDKHRLMCSFCESKFNLVNRRHHCRACGEVFCAKCSEAKRVLAFNVLAGPQRVCRSCDDLLLMQETLKKSAEEAGTSRLQVYTSRSNSEPSAPPPEPASPVSHRDPQQYCAQGPVSNEMIMQSEGASGGGGETKYQQNDKWVVYIPNHLLNENQEDTSESQPNGQQLRAIKSALKHRTSESNTGSGRSSDSHAGSHSESAKQVLFADGVSPGSSSIEDPPTSRYDVVRKSLSRGRAISRQFQMMSQQQGVQTQPQQDNAEDELEIVEIRPGAVVKRKIRETQLGHMYESVDSTTNERQPLPPVAACSTNGPIREQMRDLSEPEKEELIHRLCQDPSLPPVRFRLEANLHVNVKICDLSCCQNGECFVFVSDGLENHCQTEVVFVLKKNSPNETIPTSAFDLFSHMYRMALLGITFNNLDCMSLEFLNDFLGCGSDSSSSPGSVLFFSQTCQCDQRLPLPGGQDKESRPPLLFALLLHKLESSWAKVYPLRVLLGIGHQHKQYPCPLVSVRDRYPIYIEDSGSILDGFVDMRQWLFNEFKVVPDAFATISTTPPQIETSLSQDSLASSTSPASSSPDNNSATVLIPRNRYDVVCDVLNGREMEEELILGLSFAPFADSHLVCVETDDAKLEPQAFGQNRDGTRRCTGVGFLLFCGTLCPDIDDSFVPDSQDSDLENSVNSQDVVAKITIIEDGLNVVMCKSLFVELKQALRGMKDFQIPCQTLQEYKQGKEAKQSLSVRWIEDYEVHSPCEISPIDGMDLETKVSCNVFNAFDYLCRPAKNTNNNKVTTSSVRSTNQGSPGAVGETKSNDHNADSVSSSGVNDSTSAISSGILRWTRIFYLGEDQPNEPLVDEPNDTERLPQKLAKAFCLAMSGHLVELRALGCSKVGLRVHISVDQVEYKAGCNNTHLFTPPSAISDSMDSHLLQLVFEEAARVQSTSPIAMELHFQLLNIPQDENN